MSADGKQRLLRIVGIQLGPYRGGYSQNLKRIIQLFKRAADRKPDLICFPELMTVPYFCCLRDATYFRLAEPIMGRTINTFIDLSKKYGVSVIATLFERKRNRYFNSAVLISPVSGVQGVYRKVHIPESDFPVNETCYETYYFTPGSRFPVFRIGEVNVGVLICFDRSFPESFRVLRAKGAEAVFVPLASWGSRKKTFWEELRIRAIENGIFVVAVNKAGDEVLEKESFVRHHFGKSCMIDPFGRIVQRLEDEPDKILQCEIELTKIVEARAIVDWFRFRRPSLYRSLSKNTRPQTDSRRKPRK